MINIKDLTFGYSKKAPLFKGLNLKASEGSIIGLLGKNGAGKSTLLKLIGGLLNPHQGTMTVMDHIPFQRKPSYLQQVYFVPEEFSIPSITIAAFIKVTAPFYPAFDYVKMDSIIRDFELDSSMNLGKLSYGQKKKFLIAFALSTSCKLLLLDEPTNGLDIPSKSRFRKVMAGALSEDQMVIISTHQVKDVENLIDRIILVDQGKFIFNSSVFDVTRNFAFNTVSDMHNVDCLYKETAPGGYRILQHKNGIETPLDIELLFNAITNGTKLEIHESDI